MRLPYLISLIFTCLLGCGITNPFAPVGTYANVEIGDGAFDGSDFNVVLENTGKDNAYLEAIAYGYTRGGQLLFIEDALFLPPLINPKVSIVATFSLFKHREFFSKLSSIKIEVSWENGKSPNEKTFRFG